MGTRRLRMVLMVGMGMAAGACGAVVATRAVGRVAAPATMAGTVTALAEGERAGQTKAAVVDVDRPWMKWGEARPDAGRGRMRTDPTGFWSDAKVLQGKAPVGASTTPATREAIPKPVEPGSKVGSVEVVAEPEEVVGARHGGKPQ